MGGNGNELSRAIRFFKCSSSSSSSGSAVDRLSMSYKNQPVPASSVHKGLAVAVPTRLQMDPKSFTNATLNDANNHTAVISVKRVNPASIILLYIYVGKMSREDFERFHNLRKHAHTYASLLFVLWLNGFVVSALGIRARLPGFDSSGTK